MRRHLLNALSRLRQHSAVERFVQPMIKRRVNRSIDAVANHFFEHFELVVASSQDDLLTCYRTRHQVYCEEMGFEPINRYGLERDHFDDFALHCFIRHKHTGECAGTFRLVMPHHPGQLLPLEQRCPQAIRCDSNRPHQYARNRVCEISRLAIPAKYRQQFSNGPLHSSLGMKSNAQAQDWCDKSSFPYLSLSLYFFASSICLLRDIEQVYVMMEPKLARRLRILGIHFNKLGHEVEFHGARAAYQLSADEFMRQVSPGLGRFQRRIMSALKGVSVFGTPVRMPMPAVCAEKPLKPRQAA